MTLSDWPALVLTAGLATRLRPLSDARAKGALPVAGEPLIGRLLRWLRAAGIRDVVLNLHHRPESITRIVGDGSAWDLRVRYSWEPQVLGSAGGPRRALPLLDAERFLIINGDTLTDFDLPGLARRHVESGAAVTMAVVPGDVARYGGVVADEAGVVRGFALAGAPMPASARVDHFIGLQAADARAFAALPEGEPCDTVGTLYPRLIAQVPGSLRVVRHEAEFLDIGTPEDYFRTVEIVAAREGRALDRETTCRVHPSARVRHSILWDRVIVSEDVELVECIVTDDVVVPPGARHERCAMVNGPTGLVVAEFGR